MVEFMVNKKIEEFGSDVVIVSFSKKIKCTCSISPLPSCRKCLGTGYLAAIKKDKAVLDTHSERNFDLITSIGSSENVPIKIYTNFIINENNFVIEPVTLETFKIGSTFIERYMNGEICCYISSAIKSNEIHNILGIDYSKVSKGWQSFEKCSFSR